MWLVVGLDNGVPWPTAETRVTFEGHELLLRPETDTLAPSVVLKYEAPMSWEDALSLIHRFLSSLSWVERGRLEEIMVTGGSHPIGAGKPAHVRLVSSRFRADYLPAPANPKARLALALYRESMNVNTPAYQFLGFYKIINIVNSNGNAQKAWISVTVDRLEDHTAQSRMAELRADSENIGEYLYVSGRCAVAHAFNDPVVDPDDPRDTIRLKKDLPLMKALAEYCVEHELGVASLRAIWHEHLYELDGFRRLFGDAVIKALKNREAVSIEIFPTLPRLSLRLRDRGNFDAFENLHARPIACSNGRVVLQCESKDGLFRAEVGLNFDAEHLEFDPTTAVIIRDDGSTLPLQKALDRLGFIKALYWNSELEVWDAEHGILLGRCDAFVPENIDFRATDEYLSRIAAQFMAEIERRRQEGSGEATPKSV